MRNSSDEEFDDSRMSFSSAADYGDLAEFQTGAYDMWMAAPESITDRRRRLLEDMGLNSNKDLLGLSRSMHPRKTEASSEKELPEEDIQQYQGRTLLRSTSDGGIDAFFCDTNLRKEELIGEIPKQRLTRTRTLPTNTNLLIRNLDNGKEIEVKGGGNWNKLRDVQSGQHVKRGIREGRRAFA